MTYAIISRTAQGTTETPILNKFSWAVPITRCLYMSLCGLSTCENVVDLLKQSVANTQVFPLKYLIHFS